jgi:hypothetical protein
MHRTSPAQPAGQSKRTTGGFLSQLEFNIQGKKKGGISAAL